MKKTYQKILVLSLVIMLGFGEMSVAGYGGIPVRDYPVLGVSHSAQESQIGSSSKEADQNNKTLPSAILFQFREKGSLIDDTFEIELHVTGDVARVKMATAGNQEETKALEKEENPTYADGYLLKDNLLFSQQENDEPTEVVPNPQLGYSVSVTEVENTQTLESDAKVGFALPDEGEYTFGLYDAENRWVANLLYDTRADIAGDISISIDGGFKLVNDNLQVTVDYTVPVSATSQNLLVTFPPFYSLSGLPEKQSGITFAPTTVAFNPSHYAGVAYGEKMVDYALIQPTHLRQSVLNISLANTVTGKISFTFTIISTTTQKQNISYLMAYFEENPDKIPLLIVAEAKNSLGEIFSSDTLIGTSLLTDAAGNAVENTMTLPEKDISKTPYIYYKVAVPTAYVPQTKFPLLSAPHYPYYDGVRLFPYVENAPLGAGETLVDIDGMAYVSVPATSSAFKYFANAFTTTTTASYSYKIPPHNYLKAENYLTAGPVYLEYTYKGQRVREIEFSLNDFPLGKALKPLSAIYYQSTRLYSLFFCDGR